MIGKTTALSMTGTWLLTGTLLLAGCGDGEARTERAVPSAQAPAPGAEQPEELADSTVVGGAADDGADVGATDPNQPVEHRVEEPAGGTGADGSGSDGSPGPRAAPEPQTTSEPRSTAERGVRQASPEAILRATSTAYEGLRSFRAEFEQTLQNTIIGRTTTSRGTVYQRQPDRFLMDFSDPEDDLIVSDGDYFWMYFPSVDAKQVLRTPRGAQGLDLHAQFIGDPVRRFETTYHGTETVRGRPAHVMTLVPRERLGYQRLKVWIDHEDHLVRRFELTEANDNVRHFEFRDMVRNPTLPNDLFEFTPPQGAQVVTR